MYFFFSINVLRFKIIRTIMLMFVTVVYIIFRNLSTDYFDGYHCDIWWKWLFILAIIL